MVTISQQVKNWGDLLLISSHIWLRKIQGKPRASHCASIKLCQFVCFTNMLKEGKKKVWVRLKRHKIQSERVPDGHIWTYWGNNVINYGSGLKSVRLLTTMGAIWFWGFLWLTCVWCWFSLLEVSVRTCIMYFFFFAWVIYDLMSCCCIPSPHLSFYFYGSLS